MGRDIKKVKITTVMEEVMGNDRCKGGIVERVTIYTGICKKVKFKQRPERIRKSCLCIAWKECSGGRTTHHLYTDEEQWGVYTQRLYQDSKVNDSE